MRGGIEKERGWKREREREKKVAGCHANKPCRKINTACVARSALSPSTSLACALCVRAYRQLWMHGCVCECVCVLGS